MASLPTTSRLAIPGSTTVLGLPVHPIDLEGVVQLARQAVAEDRRLRIAVTNANKCYLAARDPGLRSFLESADLVVPETAVVWAARVLGRQGVEAVWGVVLAAGLLAEADRLRWSVFMVGASAQVSERAAAVVRARYPHLRLAGHHHGYLSDPATRGRVVHELERARADLLLVAMGSPLQERFLAELPEGAAPRISIGVGGTFDVLAGVREPAPDWIRGTGLEWLWRSVQSPRLLARYLIVNPWFVGAVLRERLLGPPRPGRT